MNRVGLAVVVAALTCGGCSDDDADSGAGSEWAATRNLPTRVYGGATTGNRYSETAGAIRNSLWVVGEDAPPGVAAQPNRAQLELPEAAPPGVIGLWVVSQIAFQWGTGDWSDWEDVHTIFFPWGGAGFSSPVPAAPSRVRTHGLLLLSPYASTDANQRAATLLAEYGAWSGNGQNSVALRGLAGVPFPPGRVNSEDDTTGVASGGVLARYRVVVRPASIGR